MDLILWRHADAESASPDSARKLTERGQVQAGRVSIWLKPRLRLSALGQLSRRVGTAVFGIGMSPENQIHCCPELRS